MLEELKKKYPRFNIQSFPISTCKSCKGKGEFKNKLGYYTPCLCVCMGGDEETRILCTDGLQSTVKKLKKELK